MNFVITNFYFRHLKCRCVARMAQKQTCATHDYNDSVRATHLDRPIDNLTDSEIILMQSIMLGIKHICILWIIGMKRVHFAGAKFLFAVLYWSVSIARPFHLDIKLNLWKKKKYHLSCLDHEYICSNYSTLLLWLRCQRRCLHIRNFYGRIIIFTGFV